MQDDEFLCLLLGMYRIFDTYIQQLFETRDNCQAQLEKYLTDNMNW